MTECSSQENSETYRRLVTIFVYLSFFLDNALLTIVVPILPDYLLGLDSPGFPGNGSMQEAASGENGRMGLLFSSKALVQLGANPIVGCINSQLGHVLPLFAGSILLAACAMLFAVGTTFELMLLARSLHGVASACVAVSGMSAVAESQSEEAARGRALGRVLSGAAAGVLAGYPIGGFLYAAQGKAAPCLLLATFALADAALQLVLLRPRIKRQASPGTSSMALLRDVHVLLVSGAIWVSTTAMAVLEPCLPLWLMDTMRPPKWAVGMVFVPDSVGYLLGTSCLGGMAFRLGRWKVAFGALLLVAFCCILLPQARAFWQLAPPHLGLGLGIGAVDAALVPLLASLVDRIGANGAYGPVYALAQVAVALAYSLGPILGGQLARSLGFPWLMRLVAIINILYSPLLFFLKESDRPHPDGQPGGEGGLLLLVIPRPPVGNYRSSSNDVAYYRFTDEEEAD